MTGDATAATVLALLLPAAGFLLLALIVPLRRTGRPAGLVSLACAIGSLAAAGSAAVTVHATGTPALLSISWLPSAHGSLASIGVLGDADASRMLVLVSLVAALVQMYSLAYLHDEPARSLGRYYTYQSLFAFSMMGLVLAPNLVQLFICWELVGLCSYLLIGFWYQRPEAARAAVKAFWTTKAGDVGLLIGIVLLWQRTGTFDLVTLRSMAAAGLIPLAGLHVVTFCLYLGAAGKSAQAPFHIWLPDAMEGPTPVSALIHAATMVTAGVYLLVRTSFLFALTPDVLLVVAWVGAITALMAAILACVQTDIKRVLAYSTVSQLGYMMTALGAGAPRAGFLHLLTHGVFKALLFLGAGAVIHAVGSNELSSMGRLARRMPQTTAAFVIGTLSLAGIPFFAGFGSKDAILASVWMAGLHVPFVCLLAGVLLTAFYMFRVVFLAFFGAAPHGTHAPHGHDAPATMTVPLWVLASLSVALGIYTTVHHPAFAVEGPAWLTPAAVGAAAAGLLLAWLTYQRRTIDAATFTVAFGPLYRAALAKFWIDDAVMALYRVGLLAFSRAVGWTDRYVVDGVLNVISAGTVAAADRLRRVQTGRVQDYVFGVALGVLALLAWIGWAR